MITTAAQRAGFGGGLVVDYPNSRKARKMYLCLMVGQQEIPKALDGDQMDVDEETMEKRRDEIKNERRRRREARRKTKKGKKDVKAKEWILKKKDVYRTRGKEG